MTATDPEALHDTVDETYGGRLVEELPRLTGFLRRLGAGPEEAEDLAQDVLERALRYRTSFRPDGNLRGWLGKTAFRVWADRRAKAEREPVALGDADLELEAPRAANPDDEDELEFLLERLTDVERDVLTRFHTGGASVAEIAAALAMPEGTVKSHLHRARRRLAELDVHASERRGQP